VITINKDRALELLQQVVRGKEDYKYVGACVYKSDRNPSCLFGHALAAAGVSIYEIDKLDRDCGTIDNLHVAQEGSSYTYGFDLTWGAIEVFRAAQNKQDFGAPWGRALKAASKVHDEYTITGRN
jgi:hypothetical protein